MNFQKHIEHTAEFDYVKADVVANALRRGDEIAGRTIQSVQTKVSKTHVVFEDGTARSINRDAAVSIVRPVETEESKERSLRHYTLKRLWRRHGSTQATRADAKAKFDAQFANGHTGHWEYERVMVADLKAQVLKTWVDLVERIAERVEAGETWENQPADALAVAERMAEQFKWDILRNATRPLSPSTAVLGNIVEDVIDGAKAEFIEYATGTDIWG